MTKKNTLPAKTLPEVQPDPVQERVEETPFEAVASICSVLVVGLFILTFLAQNFVIPSGSMENTLLVGDHLVVDRITLAPPAKWMPLVYYREPRAATSSCSSSPATLTCSWSSGSSRFPATISIWRRHCLRQWRSPEPAPRAAHHA